MNLDRKAITIYLKKPLEFRAIITDVVQLWFDTYGIYQSKGDMVLTALCYTRDSLRSKERPQESESTLFAMYARVGK